MKQVETGMVSVLIPTYNSENYIVETIESVLSQAWPSLEVVVVDDGSQDQSVERVRSFGSRVRCISRPHMGLAATRNAAMQAAGGEYFLHLDADDLLTENSIAIRMAALAAEPAYDGVIGPFTCFHSPELDSKQRARLRLPNGPQYGHLSGAAVIRAAAFTRFGGLDESLKSGADLDWFISAKEAGIRLLSIQEIVYLRRIHGANMSLTMKKTAISNQLHILKRSLDRRRGVSSSDLNGDET